MGDWRPIETAPRDGTPILVYAQLNPPEKWAEAVRDLPPFMAVTSWHPDAGFCVCEMREPTHWMPLPERPV